MPSRSSRRLKKIPGGVDSTTGGGDNAPSKDPSSHAYDEKEAAADEIEEAAADDIDQLADELYASSSSRAADNVGGGNVGGTTAAHNRQEEETRIIRTSTSALANDNAVQMAFEPPPSSLESRPREEGRAIEVQIAVGESTTIETNVTSTTERPTKEDDQKQQHPQEHPPPSSTIIASTPQIREKTPSRGAAIALPIVTMETRRETFASASPFTRRKKREKIKPESSSSVVNAAAASSSNSRHGQYDEQQQIGLSASSSSEIDEETARMKDIFSPPPPSSLRSRRLDQRQLMVDTLPATVTTSTSLDASHVGESPVEESRRHHEEYTYESPPTVHTSHISHHPPQKPHSEGRTAVSTAFMRLKGLRVVHRPKSKEGGEAADGGDDSLSSNSEEELAAAVAPTGTEAKRKPHNQQYRIKSAPARLPVSRQDMASSFYPQQQQQQQQHHYDFGAGVMHQHEHNSHEDNIQAALQLSFDSRSPDSHHREKVLAESQHIHRDRNPSPTKKPRARSKSTSSQPQHVDSVDSVDSSSERYHPQQQQQQQYPSSYNPYYPYGGHPMMGSQGGYHSHYPPSQNQQGSASPPRGMLPPSQHHHHQHQQQHLGPPFGYNLAGGHGQHQWPQPPVQGEHSGYGWHHPPPQYQQYPQGQHQSQQSQSQQQLPLAPGSGSKRKGNLKVDTTTTAELSYDDVGPMSPPISKKRDSRGLSSASRVFRTQEGGGEGSMTTTTPEGGARLPPYHQAATPFTTSFGEEIHPTPSIGAAAEIFQAASWSPSAMQAFGREFGQGLLAPSFLEEDDDDKGGVRAPYQPLGILQDNDASSTMTRTQRLEDSLSSVFSPTQHGMITIRGSPISKKADRLAESNVEEGNDEEGGSEAMEEEEIQVPSPRRLHQRTTPSRGSLPLAHDAKSVPRMGTAGNWQQQQTPASTTTTTAATTAATTNTTGMRVKIGGSAGMESTVARRGIDGINSILRGSPVSAPPQNAPNSHPGIPPHPPPFHAPPPPHYHHHHHQGMPPAGMSIDYSSQAAVVHGYAHMPPPQMVMTPAGRAGFGKENSLNDRTVGPCTCKNSKCLKLYCVCFAAEEYCFGCKCSDCQNTTNYDAIRNKAIADTRAKNPKAFQKKTTETSHATGCKCKKSACLKKYCECFNAGITCGQKCKCANCKNFIGSQALIDRRRKTKDIRGADVAMAMAMHSAERAWKGSMSDSRKGIRSTGPMSWAMQDSPVVHAPHSDGHGGHPPPPVGMGIGMSPMQFSPHHSHPPSGYPIMPPPAPSSYVASGGGGSGGGGMIQHHHQPTSMHYQPQQHLPPPAAPTSMSAPQHASQQQPAVPTSRSSSYYRRLDAQMNKIKQEEPTINYFGPDVAGLPKTTALKIWSHLDRDDLFNASIVSKKFCEISFDKGLWTK